jgi:hypothetical protein
MNVSRRAILKCRINWSVTDKDKCVETTISVKKAEQAVLADVKLKCKTFMDMKAELENFYKSSEKSLDEKIKGIEKTLEYIDSAWKNIYSEYADRKISKEDYMVKAKDHREKKQALSEELERLKAEWKQNSRDDSTDKIEQLLQRFCEAGELTNEIKSEMIEKVLVYGNNALEIYWKPDFAKYFQNISMIREEQ